MNKQLAAIARTSLDDRVAPLRAFSSTPAPNGGWIRAIREALGMSATAFAQRCGTTRQTAQSYEANEADGSIRLETLRRAAEALDCRLVYALVPNTTLNEMVANQARRIAEAELSRVDQTMLLENQRVDARELEAQIAWRSQEIIGTRLLWASPEPA